MSDDLPKRYSEAERLRQLEARVAHLSVGGGASGAETTILEDEAGVVRYESGLLADGSYGVQIYDANGIPASGSIGGGGASDAAHLEFTPVGNITAINTQDAVEQLDAIKADTGHTHTSGGGSSVDETALRAYQRNYVDRLRRWYGDAARASTQQVNIVVIGDSVASGSSADPPPSGYTGSSGPGRWIEVVMRRLQSAWGTGQGSVFKNTQTFFDNGTTGTEWTHSGSVTSRQTPLPSGPGPNGGGLGLNAVDIGANTANYIQTVQECDSFQIFYPQGLLGGMGDFNVIVDGFTVATVDIPQTGGAWGQVWDSRVAGVKIGPGKHTIRLQTAVTGNVILEGGIFYNGDYGTGVHVYNGAHGGYTSQHFVDNQNWAQSVGTVGPSLVIYSMGLNDLILETSIPTFTANVNATLDAARTATTGAGKPAPSELIVIPHAHAWDGTTLDGIPRPEHPESDWLPYRDALYEVAESRGAAVVDSYLILGYGKTSADTADLFASDEIHLNERGHRVLGSFIADFLAPGQSERGPTSLTLPLLAETPRPPVGSAVWRLKNYAGRATPEVMPAAGLPTMAGVPFNKFWVTNQPGVTTLNVEGYGGLGSSTGTVNVAGPTPPFFSRYVEYSTAATINTNSGQADNDLLWSITGGFFFMASVMFTGLNNARTFIGLTSGTLSSTVSAADPGNQHIGFAFSSGFTWQFSTRNGTTRTVDTTVVPINLNEPVEFYIWCPSLATSIQWAIRSTAAFQTGAGTATATLPGANTTMRRSWAIQTTDALSKAMRVVRLYCETDH